MTKEELIAENARLQSETTSLEMLDVRRRREFAKAFNWYKPKGVCDSHGESDPITPSWEQIFVQIGRLNSIRDVKKHSDKFEHFEKITMELESRIGNIEFKQQQNNINH